MYTGKVGQIYDVKYGCMRITLPKANIILGKIQFGLITQGRKRCLEFLKDDTITAWGTLTVIDTKTYTAVLGAKVQIPEIDPGCR